MIDIAAAVMSLRPGTSWVLTGFEYSGLEWKDPSPKPTEAEIEAEHFRLKEASDAVAYKKLRAAEYPPVQDYLDAVVKGDQAQLAKYISDCLAVKQKYPKPEKK